MTIDRLLKYNGDNKGFSVTEIVVAIFLIAVLISLAIPYVADLPERAREARIIEDMNTLRQLVLEYAMDSRMTRGFRVGMDPFYNIDGNFVTWERMLEYSYIDRQLLRNITTADGDRLFPQDPYGRAYSIVIQHYSLNQTNFDNRGLSRINLYWLEVGREDAGTSQQDPYSILIGRGGIR